MKLSRRILTAILAVTILLGLAIPALAAIATKNITVETDVKVFVNDKALDAGDTHGNPDCFIYNGTTYVAVAAVSKSLGQNVKWEGNTRSVYISSPMEEPAKDSNTKAYFGIGEKVDLDGTVVTLKSVTESFGGNFMEPDDGNVFLICEFEIENKSNKELSVSSILSFKAYADDYATSLSLSGLVAVDKPQLDGSVAAGKKITGIVAYEVPESWKELEVSFTPDIWSGGSVNFLANKQ